MSHSSQDAMLMLTLTPGLGPVLTHRCLEAMGTPEAVLASSMHHLAQVRGIGLKRGEQIRRAMDQSLDGTRLVQEKELIEKHGVSIVTIQDARYPRLLRYIYDPPPLLYVRGELHETDAVALAIVGTRRCTSYGRHQADRLAGTCAHAGLCIVSGGAYGIDASAHYAALRVGRRTIAVLGSGLANIYPPEHADLFDQIAGPKQSGDSTSAGAIISELPMTSPPVGGKFSKPQPNYLRLVVGYIGNRSPDAVWCLDHRQDS